MKRYVVILLIVIANVCDSHAQLFEYTDLSYDMVMVRPLFDTIPITGEGTGFMSFDNDYFINTINETGKEALPPKILTMLEKNHIRFRIIFFIANTGEVFHLRFDIGKEILDLISEEQLFEIYKHYRAIKFDICKATITGDIKYEQIAYFAYKP